MEKPQDLDEGLYEKAFEFLLGFFLFPFVIFVLTVSTNIALKPNSISDGAAIVYVAMLTGLYSIFLRNRRTLVYFGNGPIKTKYRMWGLITFFILAITFLINEGLDWYF